MRTFSFLVLCLMGFFFMACDDDENRLGDWALGSAWPGEVRNQAVCFVIDDYAYVGLGIGINGAEYTNFRKMNLNTGYWTVDSVAPFPGKGRHAAVAFAVNGKAYVGTGFRVAVNWGDEQYNREYLYDFWEYDPSGTTTEDGVTYQGKWTRAADFPHQDSASNNGGGRRDAIAFAFDSEEYPEYGNYGYVGLGRGYNDVVYNDFYVFNPNTTTQNEDGTSGVGSWSVVRSCEGDGYIGNPRYGASVFIVDGSAYICLGAEDGSTRSTENIKFTPDGNGGGIFELMQALTEKPDNKQDADYDRIPRAYAVAFTSNAGKDGQTYGYIAGGNGTNYQTVWRYDHIRDRWHQVENMASTSTPVGGVAFSVRPNGGNYTYGMYTTMGGSLDQTTSATLSSQSWWFFPDIKEWRGNDYTNTPVGQYRYGN